jgi:hypothetical protein
MNHRARAFNLDSARCAGRLLAEYSGPVVRCMSMQARRDALDWYPINALKVVDIGAAHRIGIGPSIYCAATLSPATSWAGLLENLSAFMADALDGDPRPDFPTYGRQRSLAALGLRYRWGPDKATGPKVSAFARALAGDAHSVVIDRHSARIAWGRQDVEAPTLRQLRVAQEAHRRAGSVLGIAPRDLQALLWVARVGFEGAYTRERVPA